ncbi:MAG: MFS transporter [Alphaproteobacteria bacterium]|nr:MFS transporter [Alphaproteobacteria bacterium]
MRYPLAQTAFLNVGHAYTHLFLLLYPTVVLALEHDLARSYAELIALSTWSFAALGLMTYPAGWLGDRVSRKGLMVVFFVGIGAAAILTGLARGTWQIAAGLGLIGAFAAIYHPVGIALIAEAPPNLLGRVLGVNGVFGNLGLAFAPIVGGALVAEYSWRAAFIVPGAVSIATGALYAAFGREARGGATHKRDAPPPAAVSAGDLRRILVILGLATIASGFIFGGTTVSLPKLVEERWASSLGSVAAVGGVTTVVLLVAATAQIIMGTLLDRRRLRPLYVGFAAVQAPLLLFVALAAGVPFVASATALMFVVFGLIPIGDLLVARFVPSERRARVYAIIYVLSFGVGTIAVPALAWIEAAFGLRGFYLFLAALGGVELLVALALPAAANRLPGAAPIAEVGEAR